MRTPLTLLILAAACAVTGTASAEDITVDLAKEHAGGRIERTVSPGTTTITFFHLAPKPTYSHSVVRRTQVITAFKTFTPPSSQLSIVEQSKCETQLIALMSAFGSQDSESVIPKWFVDAPSKLGKCSKESIARTIADLKRQCTLAVPVRLMAGEEATIALSRDGRSEGETLTWTVYIRTQARGEWVTTYGVATIPVRDERFWLNPTANAGEFVIARADRRSGELRYLPCLFFTWLSSRDALHDYAWGPTAGVGAGSDVFSLFLGWSVLHNWNVQLSTGAAAFQVARLNDKYRVGGTVRENLSEDQLHRETGWLGWYAALTFRFGDNPFKSDESKSDESKPAGGPESAKKEEIGAE